MTAFLKIPDQQVFIFRQNTGHDVAIEVVLCDFLAEFVS